MVSNTGCSSPGDLEMTFSTSELAFCCCSASSRSRVTPKSGHQVSAPGCLLCAKSGHMHRNKERPIRSPRRPAKKRERNCEAQCFGSLLVDHKLKFCRLLDRQIGWFFALENSPDVCAN